MKKITLLILTFLLSFSGFSQVLDEGFEGGTFPPTAPGNWAVFQNGFGSNVWTTNILLPHTGTTAAQINSRQNIGMGNTSKDFLATPLVTVPANGQLRFWARTAVNGNQGTRYQIRVASGALPANQTDETAYTALIQEWTEDELSLTYNVYEEKIVDLAAYAGQQIYIAFVDEYTQTGPGLSGDSWLLDDVKLVSQCFDPTGLTAGTFTLNSAVLSWGNPSGATSWEIEILPAASTPTGFGAVINTNPYTATAETAAPFTPLQPATSYKYYVKALCTTVGSQWIGPFTFSTATPGSTCLAPIVIPSTLPYVTNSDTVLYGNNIAGPQGAGCAGGATNYMTGNDVVYSYTPTVTGPITITLTSSLANSSIYVYNSCANIGVNCLAGVANTTAAPRVIVLTVTAGQTYYIVISKRLTPVSAAYNLTIVANTCTNLAATFSVVGDCANGAQFFVAANVTNMGSATSIVATDNQASAPQTISAPGVIQFGPFPNGTNVTVSLQNEQDANCFITSANQTQAFCPATNDLCANAIPIACGGTETQTTVGATTTGAPTGTCGTTAGAGGLWYSYVGTGDIVTFSLCTSAYNTKIQIVTGVCGAFTCVAGDDNGCGNQSQVLINSVLGVNYYIYVFGSGTAQGVFTLNVSCVAPPPPPVNDNCDTAIIVPTNPTDVCTQSFLGGTTLGATPSTPLAITPCLGTADDDVWFEFVATNTTHLINLTNVVGGTTNLNHIVYSGNVCGTLTQLYCSDPNTSMAQNLIIGDTYKIRVYTSLSVVNQSATFDVCITSPPVNDNCDTAIVVPTNPTEVCTQSASGTTVGATPSTPLAITPCLGTADDDVWFEFVATATTHVISLTNVVGGTTNLNHIVYSGGGTCGSLTQLYCSDPNGSIAPNLIIGDIYKIRVYTSGSAVTQSATFDVCITVPPLNDVCSGAIFVPVNSNSVCNQIVSGTISGATPSLPTLTAPCVGIADDDVWFQFTASNTYLNIALMNVVGTTTNLNHAVYSSTCGSLSLVYCSAANALNSVANNLTVGQIYYLRVYSNANTPQITTFNVCISTPSTCSNSSTVCTANYLNTVGVTSLGTIGCLATTPNPTYFTIQIQTTGPVNYLLTQTSIGGTAPDLDVDYAAWGPFTSQSAGCTAISAGQAPGIGVPVTQSTGCSYSAAPTETLNIANAQAGQFYIVLITNYSNTPGNISLSQVNVNAPGAGQTVCCPDAFFKYNPTIYCKNGLINPVAEISPNSLAGTFSSPGLVFVDPFTGEVDLVASPAGTYTITNTVYASGNCTSDKTATYDITIVEQGGAIISYTPASYCQNDPNTYMVSQSGATPGTYSVLPPSGLSINSATGEITPSTSTPGNYVVYYTVQNYTVCQAYVAQTPVEIIATPTITGILNVCVGATTQLTGSITAAALTPWASSDIAIATVDTNGLVTGVAVGTATITYTNSNGCSTTAIVTVNALPVISGIFNACVGTTTQLSSIDPPAATTPWTSSDVAVATVDANGLVTGVSAGTTVISYTNSNGCIGQAIVTITAPIISGTLSLCEGDTTQLASLDTPALVTPWVSSDTGIATVDTNGLVTGVAAGTAIITFTNNNECTATATVTVYATPTISGILTACIDATTQLTGSGTPALTTPWISSDAAVATVDTNGLVTGVAAGTTVITYTTNNGCTITAIVTITPLIEPLFTQIAPICLNNGTPPSLPIISNNLIAITGVWNPAFINTGTAGTSTYVFVPAAGQCASETNMEITILPEFAVEITEECQGPIFVLTALPIAGSFDPLNATYEWTGPNGFTSAPSSSPTVTIQVPGIYIATVTSNGCASVNDHDVANTICTIQKGISPNGDGENEFFLLSDAKKLQIFNRYGTKVYSFNNYTNQWHGQSDKGDELPDATYYYVIERSTGESITGWIYINR